MGMRAHDTMRRNTTAEALGTNLFLTACGAVALGLACAALGCGAPAITIAVGGLLTASGLAALTRQRQPMRAVIRNY